MGSAMMIGVAQVIGMKPTFRSFFSGGPGLSWASVLAADIGKTDATAADAVAAPTRARNSRRLGSRLPKTARSIARSTRPAILSIANPLGCVQTLRRLAGILDREGATAPARVASEQSKGHARRTAGVRSRCDAG